MDPALQRNDVYGDARGGQYAIVIERAGSNYSAYVPELPGCAAAGATQREVEVLLREAIELHIAGMREDNQPVPEPSSRVEYLDVEVAAP